MEESFSSNKREGSIQVENVNLLEKKHERIELSDMTSKLHIFREDMKMMKSKIWEQTEDHVVIKKTMQNAALYSPQSSV